MRTKPTRQPAKCGTDSGYYRHNRLRTPPCEACLKAHAEAVADYARRRKVAGHPLPKERKQQKACPICGTPITDRATYCKRDAALRRKTKRRRSMVADEIVWVHVGGILRARRKETAA